MITRFTTVTFLSLSVLVTSAMTSGCSKSTGLSASATKNLSIVTIINPERLVVQDSLSYTGRFEPSQKVEVRSRVSGYLQAIKFQDGQQVKAGDPLFMVDDRPFIAARNHAKANLAQAVARQRFAATQFDRATRLHRAEISSTEDLERARGELESANAVVLSAEAELQSAELELSFTTVRAPISGRVSDRRVDVGNYIAGGTNQGGILTTIVAQRPVRAVIDVTEADFRRLRQQKKLPEKVELVLDGEDRPRTANIDFLDNEFSARSGTVRMRASLANTDDAAVPGNFMRMRIPVGQAQERFVVPDSAIYNDQAKKKVFVVDGNGKVASKFIELGALIGNKRVILSGLAADDKVIVSGGQRVRPGEAVQVASPGKAHKGGA